MSDPREAPLWMQAIVACIAGAFVMVGVVLTIGMLISPQDLGLVPPPPADDAHRIVQETCVTCHIKEGVIR